MVFVFLRHMKKTLFILFLFISQISIGKEINYKLSMPKPQNHYFHVEMCLEGFKEKEIIVKLPVWAPGSYLVREFSKNINQVRVLNELDKPLLHTAKKLGHTLLHVQFKGMLP